MSQRQVERWEDKEMGDAEGKEYVHPNFTNSPARPAHYAGSLGCTGKVCCDVRMKGAVS